MHAGLPLNKWQVKQDRNANKTVRIDPSGGSPINLQVFLALVGPLCAEYASSPGAPAAMARWHRERNAALRARVSRRCRHAGKVQIIIDLIIEVVHTKVGQRWNRWEFPR